MNKLAFFGHHKCASTSIATVMGHVARALDLRCHHEYLSTRLPLGAERCEDQKIRVAEAYRQIGEGAFDMLCHGNADRAVVAALDAHAWRGFHVVRDPRDLLVSGYFWHCSSASETREPNNSWNAERRARLLAAPDKESGLLLDMEFSQVYFAAMDEWDYRNESCLELKFETMVQDPEAFYRRVFSFLRIDDRLSGRLPALLAEGAFERLAQGRKPGEEARDHKYRKGVAGDWRNHFTPRITERFKSLHGALLVKLGYERDVDWR